MPKCVFMCPENDEPGGKECIENYIISSKWEFFSKFQ
jgi:hypothetical protein